MYFLKSKWIGSALLTAFVFSAVFCCCWTKNAQAAGHPSCCNHQPSSQSSSSEQLPYNCKSLGLLADDSNFVLPQAFNHFVFSMASIVPASNHAPIVLAKTYHDLSSIYLTASPPIYILHSVLRI